MDLSMLCSIVPKTMVTDSEAVVLLRASMEATSKVYKNAQIYFSEEEKQQGAIKKLIEHELGNLNENCLLWYGAYRGNGSIKDSSAEVEFWFLINGVLVMRNIPNNQWSCMTRKLTRKQWDKIQTENRLI
jgi:hypothetical protein